MSDKVYNALKWITTIALPAIGTAYFGLAQIWNLPYAEQVVGTITTLVTLFGALLAISTNQYKKTDLINAGTLMIDTSNPESDKMRLDLGETIGRLSEVNSVVLKVDTDADLSGDIDD